MTQPLGTPAQDDSLGLPDDDAPTAERASRGGVVDD